MQRDYQEGKVHNQVPVGVSCWHRLPVFLQVKSKPTSISNTCEAEGLSWPTHSEHYVLITFSTKMCWSMENKGFFPRTWDLASRKILMLLIFPLALWVSVPSSEEWYLQKVFHFQCGVFNQSLVKLMDNPNPKVCIFFASEQVSFLFPNRKSRFILFSVLCTKHKFLGFNVKLIFKFLASCSS